MVKPVEFETVTVTDPVTRKQRDAVAVIRNGRQVALLPEADRLRRALNLPMKEIEHIVNYFPIIMNREPTSDEREFWKAVLDYKRQEGRQSTYQKSF